MVQKKSSITLAQAFEGMILSKQAEGKFLNTINDYRNSFRKLALYLDSNRNRRNIEIGLGEFFCMAARGL